MSEVEKLFNHVRDRFEWKNEDYDDECVLKEELGHLRHHKGQLRSHVPSLKLDHSRKDEGLELMHALHS